MVVRAGRIRRRPLLHLFRVTPVFRFHCAPTARTVPGRRRLSRRKLGAGRTFDERNLSMRRGIRWIGALIRAARMEIPVRFLLRGCYSLGFPLVINRYAFADYLNARGLCGEMAEIGVRRGDFSEWMLKEWKGKRLYAIDPWREFSEEVYPGNGNIPQQKQDGHYRITQERLKGFGGRSVILRKTSAEAAADFADGQLDFVYIDGAHDYDNVVLDLNAWYPKVRKGGVLAGHDYLDGNVRGAVYGVKRAVNEFGAKHGYRVRSTLKEENHPSWFLIA